MIHTINSCFLGCSNEVVYFGKGYVRLVYTLVHSIKYKLCKLHKLQIQVNIVIH